MAFDPTHVEVLGDHDACGVGFVADRHARSRHEWLAIGLEALDRLSHRGGTGDGLGSADGCGVLTAIPWAILDEELPRERRDDSRVRAAGTCFFPPSAAPEACAAIEIALQNEGWTDVWWRQVPVDASRLGDLRAPSILQLVTWSERRDVPPDWSLFRARLRAQHLLATTGIGGTVASLSTRTIVYKALVVPSALPQLLPNLRNPRFATPFVVFHQRFSTNTFPDWSVAQPFHLLAHNGEINTIVGNRLKAARRQLDPASLPQLADLDARAVGADGSDSKSLDAQIALLVEGGLSLPHAAARALRRAWEEDRTLSADERAFEQWQSMTGDSWEGPAAVAMTDGRHVGMVVDRSGFRPARVLESSSGLIAVGSETGIVDVADGDIVSRGRVGPGEMLFVDLEQRRVLDDRTLRRTLALAKPYRQMVAESVARLPSARRGRSRPRRESIATSDRDERALKTLQRHFAYTAEELEVILRPMCEQGAEAIGSMGDDTPLAALSPRSRLLTDFFRQRFAQVTNPPLDPLREQSVMSLRTLFGREGPLLHKGSNARVISAESPILTDRQLASLGRLPRHPAVTLPMVFDVARGATGMQKAVGDLIASACQAARNGAVIIILSDRQVDGSSAPIPAVLATSAVYHALGRAGLGTRAALVLDTGEARDAHQTAALIAFGAAAVCPWLAYATVRANRVDERSMRSMEGGALAPPLRRREDRGERSAAKDRDEQSVTDERDERALTYRSALEQGLLKILSKMGVCTIDAYRGSQLFEIIGFEPRFAARFFPSTAVIPGTMSFDQAAAESCDRHREATRTEIKVLSHPGFHGFRKDGDHHIYNPQLVRAFHDASRTGSPDAYARFVSLLHSRPATTVRDLLTFAPASAIPIEEVEPADAICTRFFASAMSVGALGPEAHRTLATAMNQIGARSNSGEGGEEAERYARLDNGQWANSATKQVASARFGVTPAYLRSARELQIKMAQGSKPGEGGQLPAQKVVDHIARLRHAQPGTPLISPPPHHDIYSIEDLAQLIYDLRAFHPHARINVKLVATTGVGVIAAGVVKAGADAIQISGHAGGTGASPRGSIKHAGLPWEIGLLETHRVLASRRGVRPRVVLQTDGGLVTGRDIAMAAALGADEYGFGTSALIALGCVMARQCHLNTCPVGIATQRPDLRAKFAGTVDEVVTYLRMVAEETRGILATLGLRSLRELVGRLDLVQPRAEMRGAGLDVHAWIAQEREQLPRTSLANSRVEPSAPSFVTSGHDQGWQRTSLSAHTVTLNDRLLGRARHQLGRRAVTLETPVRNTDRSLGASLMGALVKLSGNRGIPHTPVKIILRGDAGQSLGAFALPGTEIHVRGTANDGVAKGMHGGLITIALPHGRSGDVAIGNAALYGATGGHLFVAGHAGERFAVRNSGATAVVEGVGDHGCEYMTGGTVVILGGVGRNFGAGMTGGMAFVNAVHGAVRHHLNADHVTLSRLNSEQAAQLLSLVHEHYALTGSTVAADVLASWPRAARGFRVIAAPVAGGTHNAVPSPPPFSRRAGVRPDRRGVAADATAPTLGI